MTDDFDEMKKEMEEYRNMIVVCTCGCVFDFDTNKVYKGIEYGDGRITELIVEYKKYGKGDLVGLAKKITRDREEANRQFDLCIK